jgi:hypothetical protein
LRKKRSKGFCNRQDAQATTPVGQPIDQHLVHEVRHDALKERHVAAVTCSEVPPTEESATPVVWAGAKQALPKLAGKSG